MPDSKYFGIPFGASGDRAAIPEATQPGGSVSYQQGFGPDYERDPETDPLAKRVPRPGTNEYLYQITNTLKWLQLYGLPEWYAADDSGDRVSYPIAARVRHSGAVYVSLIANNLTTPGEAPASWALDEAFSFTALEASVAEMQAGTAAGKITTPRRVASAVQRGAWNYATAGGGANALTASLTPAPTALTAGLEANILLASTNTGAVTLNLNGLGVRPVVRPTGLALKANEFPAGAVASLRYDGANWQLDSFLVPAAIVPPTLQSFDAVGTSAWVCPAGVFFVDAEVHGGGGGGAGSVGNPPSASSFAGEGGAGGGYSRGIYAVTPGQSYPVVVGAGGAGGPAAGGAGPGGTSSFGSFLSATGGTQGRIAGFNSAPNTAARPGGIGSGGQVNLVGGWGGIVKQGPSSASPGDGGAAPLGGLGAVASATAPGSSTVPGGGGGGAGGTANLSGSAGSIGRVVLRY